MAPLCTEVIAGAVGHGGPDQLRQCFQETLPTVLALAKGLFGPPAYVIDEPLLRTMQRLAHAADKEPSQREQEERKKIANSLVCQDKERLDEHDIRQHSA